MAEQVTPAPPPAPPATPPAPAPPPIVAAPPIQFLPKALYVLAGVAICLVAWRWLGDHRGARPAESRPDPQSPYRVELNRATREELVQIPGVGPEMAGRILAYRDTNGAFRSVEELRHVHGIGDATLKRLQPWVSVETPGSMGPSREMPAPDLLSKKKPAESSEPQYPARAAKIQAGEPPIDINRADEQELQRLPRIGPVMAKAIITTREANKFTRIEDLRKVKGIGPKTFEQLKPFVTVSQ